MNSMEKLRRLLVEVIGNDEDLAAAELEDIVLNAEAHASENTYGDVGRANLCLVHPYFMKLVNTDFTHVWEDIQGIRREEDYESNIERLLKRPHSYNVILFESHIHYILRSYRLAERGLVDKVIFTHYGQGDTITKYDLFGFAESEVNYLAGTTGHVCVEAVRQQVREMSPDSRIRPVVDAIEYNDPAWWCKLPMHLALPYFMLKGDKDKANKFSFHVMDWLRRAAYGITTEELTKPSSLKLGEGRSPDALPYPLHQLKHEVHIVQRS